MLRSVQGEKCKWTGQVKYGGWCKGMAVLKICLSPSFCFSHVFLLIAEWVWGNRWQSPRLWQGFPKCELWAPAWCVTTLGTSAHPCLLMAPNSGSFGEVVELSSWASDAHLIGHRSQDGPQNSLKITLENWQWLSEVLWTIWRPVGANSRSLAPKSLLGSHGTD